VAAFDSPRQPRGALASPALTLYRDLLEVVTRRTGAHTFSRSRAGSIVLIRPDGYIAARGTPDRLDAVPGYLQELSRPTEISQLGQTTASGKPGPMFAAAR
jgi:hypothetical protein